MGTSDWIVVIVGLAIIAGISIRALFRQKQAEDYFTGGHHSSVWLLSFFSFGAGTGNDSPGMIVASTWRSGMSGLWWQFIWLLVTPFFWVLAPILRRLRAVTTADFFLVRFGRSAAFLYSVLGVLISIIIISGILFGSSRLLNTVCNPFFDQLSDLFQIRYPMINLNYAQNQQPLLAFRPLQGDAIAALFLAAFLILCGLVGGLRAGLLIDCVQGVLQIGITLLLLPLLISRIGGLGTVGKMQWLKPGMLDFVLDMGAKRQLVDPMTPTYVAAIGLAGLLGMLAHPHLAVVCGSAGSERDVRAGFTAGNLLKRIMSIAWGLIGLGCVILYLGPASPLVADSKPSAVQLQTELREAATIDVSALPEYESARLNSTDRRFSDRVFGLLIRDLLTGVFPGLLGLCTMMLISTTVSHCVVQMVTGSALIAIHLCRNYLTPNQPDSVYLFIGRLCGPVIVLLALFLQMTYHDIGDFLRLFIRIPAIIGISMWMGIFWTRWNVLSVWTATGVGLLVSLICGFFPGEVWTTFPGFRQIMFEQTADVVILKDSWSLLLTLGTALIAGISVTLVQDFNQEDLLEFFYRAIQTKVSLENRDMRITEFSFSDDDTVIPSISLFGLQIPGPTRGGTLGFLLTLVTVAAVILATRWFTLRF